MTLFYILTKHMMKAHEGKTPDWFAWSYKSKVMIFLAVDLYSNIQSFFSARLNFAKVVSSNG